jgi:hypothetical protein
MYYNFYKKMLKVKEKMNNSCSFYPLCYRFVSGKIALLQVKLLWHTLRGIAAHYSKAGLDDSTKTKRGTYTF